MRRALPLALLLTSLLPAQAASIPELKPAMVLAVGERVLAPWATLLIAPDRGTVAALGEAGLQLWDGRSGTVLKSTLPRVDGRINLGCGGDSPSTPIFSDPPAPVWDEVQSRFHLSDWRGHQEISVLDGHVSRVDLKVGAEAIGLHSWLVQEDGDRLRVGFAEGETWSMEARSHAGPPGQTPRLWRFALGHPGFRLVALASDGSRVAAIWAPWLPGGSGPLPYYRGASHLLVWRRGDRLPSVDLPWEGQDPLGLSFTPSGKALLARLEHESLVLDPDTGREKAVIPTSSTPYCWVPGQDHAVFELNATSRTYALWDLEWGDEVRRFSLPETLDLPAGDSRTIDESSGGGEDALTPYLSAPRAISPDGRWIAILRASRSTWRATEVVLFELDS